jgi:hypothetical protein
MRSDCSPRVGAIVVLALVVLLVGCDATTARRFGLANDENLPAVMIDILCDSGAGSTCTTETLNTTLDRELAAAAERPESIVRLWSMGTTVGDTTIVGVAVSPQNTKRGRTSRKLVQDHFVATAKTDLLKAIEPRLAGAARRRSPIAESIARIVWAAAPPRMPRRFVIITDAREVSSFGDFECGVLPKPGEFVEKLHSDLVLPSGSLNGVAVEFIHVSLGAVDGDRCAFSLSRAAAIRELWKAAITSAGAGTFRYETTDAAVTP